MAIIWDQRAERANAITLPPAPANMSIKTVLEGEVKLDRSSATLLEGVRESWDGQMEGRTLLRLRGLRRTKRLLSS